MRFVLGFRLGDTSVLFVWLPLGGSWVVINGVISPLIWVISVGTLRITRLLSVHEPPSRP